MADIAFDIINYQALRGYFGRKGRLEKRAEFGLVERQNAQAGRAGLLAPVTCAVFNLAHYPQRGCQAQPHKLKEFYHGGHGGLLSCGQLGVFDTKIIFPP